MSSYRQISECLSKRFTPLLVLIMLWIYNIVESTLFVLHHRETLSTGLLNSLTKRGKRRKLSAAVRTEEIVGAVREAVTRSYKRNGAAHSRTEWGLDQHCMGILS
jgi:hypothetical protein